MQSIEEMAARANAGAEGTEWKNSEFTLRLDRRFGEGRSRGGDREVAASLGYELIEFPRLDPKKFDVAWLASRLADFGLKVVVTMGLPADADISGEDQAAVKRGEQVLADAVAVTRDLGGTKLGGIIFSKHGKYYDLPSKRGWENSVGALAPRQRRRRG